MQNINLLKKKLSSNQSVFGTWSSLGSSLSMNCIAQTGLDFIITDLEHSASSYETVQSQLFHTESENCTLIARLAKADESSILKVLDTGVKSIMVSHVSNQEDALKVVNATRYYPEGSRGLSPFTKNHSYSDIDIEKKMSFANSQIFVGVLVEGEEGIKNLEKICKTPNLDMVYLGIYDLSQSVGEPGNVQHPKVKDLLRKCVKIISDNGLIAGSVARNEEYLELLISLGFKFISYRNDTSVLYGSFLNAKSVFDNKSIDK